jgi:hypothetical protein
VNRILTTAILLFGLSASAANAQEEAHKTKPGVPEAQVPFTSLKPSATFQIGGTADWVLVTDDAVWVAGSKPFSLLRIDPATNTVVAKFSLSGEACSGLAFGFSSVWVPICAKNPMLARVDVVTNRIAASFPIEAANSEGGITASGDSIWIVTDKKGATLSRINPAINKVSQKIAIPAGSYNPLFSGGMVWITESDRDILTVVDSSSGNVLDKIPVGPKPRFLAAGGNSIWTLNQGDGSVTRVEINSRKVKATIALGIPGPGGDLGYGADLLWATSFDVPLTAISGKTNKVLRQWVGSGGDSLRFGHDSIWLTDYYHGTLSRIPLKTILLP